MRHLATPEGKKEYSEYIVRDGRGIAELLETFSSCSPSWATLLELCPKLSPRKLHNLTTDHTSFLSFELL